MVNKLKLASVVMNGHKTQAKIKDIGTILTGRTPSTSDPNNYSAREICFVKPSDLLEEKITTIEDTEFYISQKARTQSVCVPENSVLVTCIGIVGKIGITTKEMAFNQQINAIIPNSGLVSYKYLAYLLSAKRKYLSELANAPVVPILNKTNFGNITLSLHPLSEQKEIAERLDKVQELIALQKEQLKKLDDLIKSRFIDLFGNPETNTKHWPLISWDSLFSVVTGKLDANAMEENGKYPFFTCAKESFRINSYAFDQKALLLAGNNATADYDVKFYEGKFNAYQRTYVISLKNEQCSYIVYKFLLEQKLQLMKRLSKGTNTRYLTLSILKDFKFLDLPVEQQTQFADFVTKIEAQKGLLATRLSHLETLYKSLMQEYFG